MLLQSQINIRSRITLSLFISALVMATASSSRQDAAVQSTNDDAATCKCSAVRLGYWKDPYVQFFAKPCDRKPPEINRGYYARVKEIDSLLKQFLQVVGHSFVITSPLKLQSVGVTSVLTFSNAIKYQHANNDEDDCCPNSLFCPNIDLH